MEMMEALKKALHELVLPELGALRAETAEIKAVLQVTNKRIDDVHAQLADHSRRIDEVRTELGGRIDEVRAELGGRIEETNRRMDVLRADLLRRLDETNRSIAHLYEVIVRRDEHFALGERVARLEQEVRDLRSRLAA